MPDGGIDYDSGPYNVTVPANEISVAFNIPISSDGTMEENEEFNLTIHATSMPTHVKIDKPDQATVIIVDDDSMLI